MAVGEFTQYVSVFISSLAGAVSGYFYFNSPDNLRIKLERNGTKLLRPSDPLWMYKRIIRQKGEKIKEGLEKFESLKNVVKIDEIKKDNTANLNPTDDQAYNLLLACNKVLGDGKWKRGWEEWAKEYCEYPG